MSPQLTVYANIYNSDWDKSSDSLSNPNPSLLSIIQCHQNARANKQTLITDDDHWYKCTHKPSPSPVKVEFVWFVSLMARKPFTPSGKVARLASRRRPGSISKTNICQAYSLIYFQTNPINWWSAVCCCSALQCLIKLLLATRCCSSSCQIECFVSLEMKTRKRGSNWVAMINANLLRVEHLVCEFGTKLDSIKFYVYYLLYLIFSKKYNKITSTLIKKQ